MRTFGVVVVGVLAIGRAAAEPAEVQDPPGEVEVDQPAGVSLDERNTGADVTDTLRGGGRTDVIDGDRAPTRADAPSLEPSQAHGAPTPGTEARTSFGGTGSGSTGAPDAPGTDAAGDPGADDGSEGSTSLGTDTGHGAGTEPLPSSPAR